MTMENVKNKKERGMLARQYAAALSGVSINSDWGWHSRTRMILNSCGVYGLRFMEMKRAGCF